MSRSASPQVSQRVRTTADPIMVQMRRLLGSVDGVLSLGQGAVYWAPPAEAIKEAASHAHEPLYSQYGSDEGTTELRSALEQKVADVNGLKGYKVIVTAGANQAVVSLMLTLLDPSDRAVLFRPYYFNTLMAIQMTGGGANVALGPSNPDTWHPDLGWLEAEMSKPQPPKVVYVVSPGNPTGVTLPRAVLERLAELTAAAGAWLVVDNTYEAFTYSGEPHFCPSAPNVIHIFSFSKAHGAMGWRVGYIAYPDADGSDFLGLQLVKVQDTIPIHAAHMSQQIALIPYCVGAQVQDTIPIHAAHMSQQVALRALRAGPEWLRGRTSELEQNRKAALEALAPLGTLGAGVWGGDAIYLWARLPRGCDDDRAVVAWLVHAHKVAVIPGSACGCAGYIRVAFGQPAPPLFREAAARLGAALRVLRSEGFAAVESWRGKGGGA